MTIFLGRTDTQLCPVAALLAYLTIRGPGEGPLFYFNDGRALTRSRLVVELRKKLAEYDLPAPRICGEQLQDWSRNDGSSLWGHS